MAKNSLSDTDMKAATAVILTMVLTFATCLQGEMAISFNGVQGYVNLYTPAAVQIASKAPFTVEALVYFRSLSNRDIIYTKSSGRTASYDYILGFVDNAMAAWDGTAYRGNISVEREINRWHHVAFVCDGTYLSFYFDGTYRGNCLFSFSNTTSYNAKIGGHLSNMDVDGFMSEARLWDHARSAGEILGNLNKRIKGNSSGLLGYWPLNEGTGTTAFDMSGGGSDGTIVGGTWYDVPSLELLAAEGFVWGETFALRDPLSQSLRFTGGNVVEMVLPPVSALYDSFQITQQETVGALQPGEWQSLANLPQELSFSQPAADTNINFYLWLTNQNTEVVLQCRQGTIIYTEALPQPSVRPTRPLVSSQSSMVIKPLAVNSGSTGGVTAGTTAGESVAVTGLHLRLLEGPGDDLTPESPWVTVDTVGSYTVELVVSNVVGNVATSTAAVVTLTRSDTPALKFNGSSSYADMGGGSFDILDDLTMAAWIKPSSISTYNTIAGQGHFQTSTYGYGLQITKADGLRFQIRMMDAGYHAIAPYTLDGLWHHVVGVREGTNIYLYVDGQLADKSTAPLGTLGNSRKFGVGAVDHGTSWNYYFKGSITDVQLWNRALSEVEITTMIGRRLDGDEVGLVGYWPFNEGAGDVAYDLMLQPHDANLVNTTWHFDSLLEFDKDEYIVAPRLYLANLTSGSRLFTNSDELKIDLLPVPEGYNAYQVTQGAAVTAIDPSGWLPAEAPWANISYAKPATESNLCFYAWYTNTTTAVALMRSEANISYTMVPPNARIRATFIRKLESDQPTVIQPDDLDNGSVGGLANKINMEITGCHLHLVSGPGADLTPLAPEVTLAVAGDYEIVLIVQNEAGNSATSKAALVSIQANSEITPLFYNSSSYIDLGTPDALQIASDHPFTVEAWIKFSHLSSRDIIFCKSNGRTLPYSYILGFADNAMAAWDGAAYRGNFPAIRETGRWYHVAFSFDGTNMSYYLDGELLGEAEYSFTNTKLHNVKIGGHITDMSFRGMISDLRVWDYARNRGGLQSTMGVRLQGDDSGLLGYWPLWEGVGEEVYDHAGNGTTGVLSQVLWSADDELFTTVGETADYLVAHSFRLADPVCGSSKFTAGTTVDIAAAPLPDGYSHYQITSAAASSNLLATGWLPVATLPDSFSFEQPSGSTTLMKYIWFTNLTASVKLQRSVADIIYSDTVPVAQVKPTYQRQLIPGSALEVHLADIDNGSSTATFFGEAVPLKEKYLILLNGPGGVPAAGEFVTLPAVGDYQIVLVIEDILGHAATSTPAVVTVTLWQNEAFAWQGPANGYWHDSRNWGLLGVPPAGADVTLGAGAIVVLDYATPLLNSVTFAGGQLVFDGAAAKLNGTEILVNSGQLSHTPSEATESDANGIWPSTGAVAIECHNFTLAAAAKIDVTGCGYGAGYQSDGYGPGGGGLGNGNNSNYSGGGGGHGGQGGQYQSRGSGGPAYDNYRKPQMAGSGGGGRLNYNYRGGAGGGVVHIAATERLVVDGVMMANGQDSSYYYAGGGAGGAIWLSCRKLAGSGTIQADGGKAGNNSGAGAGGRIAIWRATDALGSELQVSAAAGSGDEQNGLEDGTVFWKLLEGTLLMLR